MHTSAVIFKEPGRLTVDQVELADPGPDDLVIDVHWSGISTGTEKLLWSGDMPEFPGLGYPLIPGYETVGAVIDAGREHAHRLGELVYVPGSSAYRDVRGLFGGSAGTIVTAGNRARKVDDAMGRDAVLMALAATGHHALAGGRDRYPELIVGYGVLGRLMARMILALGGEPPVIWETDPVRRSDDIGCPVVDPAEDTGSAYSCICDVSGQSSILDNLVGSLAPGGEIILAGFYKDRLDFAYPAAFMKEARFRVSAEWGDSDLDAVQRLLDEGRLSFDGLITNEMQSTHAVEAYRTAFEDAACLKMILNWSGTA